MPYRICCILMAFICFSTTCQAKVKSFTIYIGTYTDTTSKGIYVADYSIESGAISNVRLAAETEQPSFIAIHPDGKHLYAVNELGEYQGKRSGAVSAFSIDQTTGRLNLINQHPSRGAHPCHIVLDQAGKHALIANYSGGNVAALPINADGSLSPATGFVQHHGSSVNPSRQANPHAHSINLSRDNRFAFVADLGLDKILTYTFDARNGELAEREPKFLPVAPGSGPRHFAFSPNEDFAFVINELANTITSFGFDKREGVLTKLQTISTLPPEFKGTSNTAEVVVAPNGRFLFGSNRGHDSIAVFTIEPKTGKLGFVETASSEGNSPRNFVISPDGRFLLVENQNSNNVVTFAIDQATGKLTEISRVVIPRPVCIRFAKPAN